MNKSDEDLEFIKKFSKISVTNICKKKKVNRGNLLNGLSTKENSKKVRKGIESEVAKLYLELDLVDPNAKDILEGQR